MANRPLRQPCSGEVPDADDDSLMPKPMQNAGVVGTDGRVCMSTLQQRKEAEEEESTTAKNKTARTTPESHSNGSRGAASERAEESGASTIVAS